jgi:cob(I)alamin adenosyltransferase
LETEAKGQIIVNYGTGKGKTTAALGTALRALGHGQKVLVLQYIKGTMPTGEMTALKRFDDLLEFIQLGIGFIHYRDGKPVITDKQIENAKASYSLTIQKVKEGDYDLIVLDEITYFVDFKILSEEDILKIIEVKPQKSSLIFTGRNAFAALIHAADTVTEMVEVKHAFNNKIKAKKGIEY